MIPIPPIVQPLVWLLLFDLVVGLIQWGLAKVGFTLDGQLKQVMLGIVIVINVVIMIIFLLGLLGYGPGQAWLPRRA